MATPQLNTSDVDVLREELNGSILTPDDDGYDEARRGWNTLFDKRPDAIARCTSADDVIAAVNFARERDLPISIRSGGHSYAGKSVPEGGFMIDLSAMNDVEIDPDTKTASVGPAVKWRTFDEAAQKFGLATTGCTVSNVGVGGYALGGGTGYLARKHGLCLDNVLSAEVVTARGELVRASEEENTDLFWALRGGSGNFGVVTSFEFQLHEVGPEVIAGQIVHPFDNATEVLRFYRDFMADAPDELTCYAFILNVPPVEGFPEKYHGKPAVFIIIGYVGLIAEGEKVLQPLQDFGDPILTMVGPIPYTAMQQMFDEGMADGRRCYSQAHVLTEISDEAIETIVQYTEALPGPFSSAYFEPFGGAINRVDPDETAFPHRDAGFEFHIFPGWIEPEQDEELIGWAREFHAALEPHTTGGVYVNLLSQDEQDRVPKAYGPNYERLTRIKKKWDPDNLFRMNHNIIPAE